MKTKSGKCTFCHKRTTRYRNNEFIHEGCEEKISFARNLSQGLLMVKLLKDPIIQTKIKEIGKKQSEMLRKFSGENDGNN